jgi:hypothetical protein
MAKNVEKLVIGWLPTILNDSSWPVAGDKPKELPAQFITVDRTGGPREAMVLDRAEILIEVYSKSSRQDASDTANMIADMVPQMLLFDEDITRATVNSVVNLDDTVVQYHRYQVYCDVYLRR